MEKRDGVLALSKIEGEQGEGKEKGGDIRGEI